MIVWQKAMDLTLEVYRLTKLLPTEEKFGWCSQIRRASVSIAANIAEGSGRSSQKEFKQFLGIANGSAAELETELMIIERTGQLSKHELLKAYDLLDEVQKMLNAFQQKITTDIKKLEAIY